jgi:hypothetical protein
MFFATTVATAPNTAAHATVSTAATSTAVVPFASVSIAEPDATTAPPPLLIRKLLCTSAHSLLPPLPVTC